MAIVLAILVAAGTALCVYAVGVYRGLVGLRENIKVAWSELTVLLERRGTLLAELVDRCAPLLPQERGEPYNQQVNLHNIRVHVFPDALLAAWFGFGPRPLLEFG